MDINHNVSWFPKDVWTLTKFGSGVDLNFMLLNSFVTWVSIDNSWLAIVWFETTFLSYWRTNRPSGKMIKLLVFFGQEAFLISMLILVQFWGFWPPNKGGGVVLIQKPTYPGPLVKGCLVNPSFWLPFIEIGLMACIALAWSSHELSFNLRVGFLFLSKSEKGLLNAVWQRILWFPWCTVIQVILSTTMEAEKRDPGNEVDIAPGWEMKFFLVNFVFGKFVRPLVKQNGQNGQFCGCRSCKALKIGKPGRPET